MAAYEALVMNILLGRCILEIPMKGISTRRFKEILLQMTVTIEVSSSKIIREFIATSEQQFR